MVNRVSNMISNIQKWQMHTDMISKYFYMITNKFCISDCICYNCKYENKYIYKF